MLDRFYSGEALRISPEAPVPVLKITNCNTMPGGAANTAMNIASLGATVSLVAPIGDDEAGRDLCRSVSDNLPIKLSGPSDPRGTILKSRYSAQGQQLLRIDEEDVCDLPEDCMQALSHEALTKLDTANLLVLSDYAKGVLSANLCQTLISAACAKNIVCVVDPKGSDYSKYRGATLITPNELELSIVSGHRARDEVEIIADAQALIKAHDFSFVAVTRGKSGVMLIGPDGLIEHVPSFAREVFDVSGAGDSFVAGLSCAMAAKQSLPDAVHYGNAVAGVAVGKSGTALVRPEEVEALLAVRTRGEKAMITTNYEQMAQIIAGWQDAGACVGVTNGVFDLLHLGHLRILDVTRQSCDRLVVVINSDASVRRLKGDSRPIQSQDVRAQVLANMKTVDMVVIFDEDTPIEVITARAPDLLVKGGDYIAENVVGYAEVTAAGGRVMIVPTLHGYSTTATVQKMQTPHG